MKIVVVVFFFLVLIYTFRPSDSASSKLEAEAKNRIVIIALNRDFKKITTLRDSIGVENLVTINEIKEKKDYYFADGNFYYSENCQHIILEWKKGKLFTPQNTNIIKNVEC